MKKTVVVVECEVCHYIWDIHFWGFRKIFDCEYHCPVCRYVGKINEDSVVWIE